jgi:hypothetical protein
MVAPPPFGVVARDQIPQERSMAGERPSSAARAAAYFLLVGQTKGHHSVLISVVLRR